MTRSKDKRDVYYRKAKEEGFRARSAFKLLQLDDEFGIFTGVRTVADLCAAPGSWSQVVSQKLRLPESASEGNCAVAVDLQDIAPIPGVCTLQGDITQEDTLERVRCALGGRRADLVLSDGAPDVTGLHDLDEYVQCELVQAALRFCVAMLAEGGKFVAKIFRGYESALLYARIRPYFRELYIAKPRSSRNSSLESFIVCRGFTVGRSYASSREELTAIPAFVPCGDHESEDPDMAYDLTLNPSVHQDMH
ncbi:probable tRNA methyltransferase Trm7 [Cyanidioschyzon merolae strain 10D]|jgi:tRNA (cytidine32/guanosine34-2'-O)-methyltransferase|uniref:Putative tRNA (cytidine(32)/guanosine(34)-2'-O)-methyltransferase n=1 Tax=Cyanidioschyzon merolae (strain NIES-3377 / 10D) TaxID=280699 RepID=M1VEV5_CYAM1|nr:probable tRNA methyltransferase Trm7 [Cyanidioschyzon merolae strain 10D]BAM79053.1 probable tRNA methyltransferase Trm7 [Cyanidioschyzon merolae strain 10D]|eukprot:XP_005535339.1 probable tRNA methyltransferase Trm7 [Cyanidioschyzon merolae strain 10D]